MEPSRKLLIIDDDDFVRQSMVAFLEDSGYQVAEAANGVDGIEKFQSFHPELVLSDLKMPGVTGLSVLEQIHSQSPTTPVIVVSGAGVMDDVVEALRLGASDYLIKPLVDMKVLEHAIHKGLTHRDLLEQNQQYRLELEEKNQELQRNLHIFERDQKAGRQVQERLLPPSPVTKGGYTISRAIHPSLYLSGDFVDYAWFLNRYLGFYLVDVAGHGASSAFVTIWLKYLTRNLMRDTDVFKDNSEQYVFIEGPKLLMEGINRELISTRLNNHLTSFQGTIDTESHKLRYAVAGHLPMPILRTEKGTHYLDGKGKPVGIFNVAEWEVYEHDLPEKFALVLFSDGILEILPGETLQDKEATLLRKLESYQGDWEIAALSRYLEISSDSDNPDDIAVLLVTRGF